MRRTEDDQGSADVAIVEESVSRQGWQPLDRALLSRLAPTGKTEGRRPTSSGAAWSVFPAVNTPSALVLSLSGAGQASRIGVPALAAPERSWNPVPASAFVSIGRLSGRVLPGGARLLGSRGANDNFVAPAALAGRSRWRDLFFLAVLAATVAGAFFSGRVHGFQRVIVVPSPSSFHSVVT
jgi:hypothetical protein